MSTVLKHFHLAQSITDFAYRDLTAFWTGFSQEPLVSWKEWIQSFQLTVIAKEELETKDLLQVNVLPDYAYPTLEEPLRTEDEQARTNR